EGFTIAGAKKKLLRSGVEPQERAAQDQEREQPREQNEPEESPFARYADAGAGAEASKTREQLTAMRADIETFLAELGPPRR
ncbi:MAG TPA: hypothetical protein VIF15_17725, partial [Polyangiaceae bacterium]